MSEDAFVKIPGTTLTVKVGTEGKYYAVYLCRGFNPFKTEKLPILKGVASDDFEEETKKAIAKLLDSEDIFLSPIIVNRVTNDLLGELSKEPVSESAPIQEEQKPVIEESTKVKELVSKSDGRAEQKSVIEHTPGTKSDFDASAEDIGKIKLKTPKPLPERDSSTQITSPTPKIMPTAPCYTDLETKVGELTNELSQMQDAMAKNKKEITNLKRQITILKKETKELKKV